ncbi:hypothetical protein EOM71_02180 [Candidatus Falkowbacteria bacterium]|nr:hypothetical protein [Candidatus Falkowbacteria bacterium]
MRKIIISSLFLLLVGLMVKLIPSVNAGTNDNLFGWAWNPVIGWISFNNCVYAGGCSGIDYGVGLTEGGNYPLTGYAWNSNVGWILFDNSYPLGGNPQHGAQFDPVTKRFSGWAQIMALGEDGWIKLAKDSYDGGSPDYWSRLQDDGKLAGWAWNNTIGWISFNSSDVTSSLPYYVTGKVPVVPQNLVVTPDDTDGCSKLYITWTASDYATGGYLVHRSTSSSFTPSTTNFLTPITTVNNKYDDGLALNTDYYYHVGANNFFGTTYSTTSVHGKTRPICGINTITGQGDCLNGDPSVIKLNWQVPMVAPGIQISYYQIKRCQVDDTGNNCLQDSPFFEDVASASDCYQVDPDSADEPPSPTPPTNHCVGIDCHCWEEFTGEEVAKQYVYKIIAVDDDNNFGDDTATLINIYPCARQKSWSWEEQNPGLQAN